MMPGVTHLPAASITTAPRGTRNLVPIASIRPSDINIDAFSTRSPVPVNTVAPSITVVTDLSGV